MQLLPHSLIAVRVFNAAAKHLSCSRAAEELCLSQSAISKHLQTLEEFLGVRLFKRVRQGLVLTNAGTVYWQAIKPALLMLGEATTKVRMLEAEHSLSLHLRVSETFGEKWLMPRLPDFTQRYPEIAVRFAPRSDEGFDHKPFSAEIRGGRGSWDGMQAHYLIGRDMVIVCSAAITRGTQRWSAAELLKFRLLEHVRLARIWEHWFAANKVTGYDSGNTQQFEQFSVLISALRASLGIACLPRCLIEEELRTGTLIQLFDMPSVTGFSYYLVYPKERYKSIALKRFSAWLLEKCSEPDMG
jgi:DNA-binding transcriptional LysR family regulator